jgi:hypothetical protein
MSDCAIPSICLLSSGNGLYGMLGLVYRILSMANHTSGTVRREKMIVSCCVSCCVPFCEGRRSGLDTWHVSPDQDRRKVTVFFPAFLYRHISSPLW